MFGNKSLDNQTVFCLQWMEDSDREDIETETLEQQFIVVKNETNTSMVCQFG